MLDFILWLHNKQFKKPERLSRKIIKIIDWIIVVITIRITIIRIRIIIRIISRRAKIIAMMPLLYVFCLCLNIVFKINLRHF